MKKIRGIAIALAFILLGSVWMGIQLKNGRESFFAFQLNWNISMPTNAKLLYKNHSETSFLGDGERYHVFQYDKTPKFPEPMKPVSAVPEEEQEDVLKILSRGMTVEEKYLPDFDRVTLRMKAVKKGSTRMYLY